MAEPVPIKRVTAERITVAVHLRRGATELTVNVGSVRDALSRPWATRIELEKVGETLAAIAEQALTLRRQHLAFMEEERKTDVRD